MSEWLFCVAVLSLTLLISPSLNYANHTERTWHIDVSANTFFHFLGVNSWQGVGGSKGMNTLGGGCSLLIATSTLFIDLVLFFW